MTRPSRRLVNAMTLCATAARLALGCVGCHFPVQSAPSDPLYGMRSFALEQVQFTSLRVGGKPEPVYLGEKKPEQQQSWQADKSELARYLMERLVQVTAPAGIVFAPPQPGAPPPAVLRVNIDFIEPGHFNGFFNIDPEIRATVSVFGPNGEPFGQNLFAGRSRGRASVGMQQMPPPCIEGRRYSCTAYALTSLHPFSGPAFSGLAL